MKSTRISRNDLCPCGSGKKFKKCCRISGDASPRFSFPPSAEPFPTRPLSFAKTASRSAVSQKKWNEVVFDAPLEGGGHLHAVLLYSDGGLNVNLLQKGEVVKLDLTDVGFRGPATVVAIDHSSAQGEVEAEVVRVAQFRDDDDLGKALYGEWKPSRDFLERWSSRRRKILLRMDFPDGRWCDIQLLRTVEWIEQNNWRVGEPVFLDLNHVGVLGWANVREIKPCPLPEEFAEGEIVTGTFKYSRVLVGELVLEAEPKPIGVTPSHLFWSEDRQTWVPVSQLRPGETVQTLNGITCILSFTLTDRVEPVNNLEVAHDHVYRVGESAVLVHNQSTECPAERDTAALMASLGSSPYSVPGRAHHIFPVSEFDTPLGITLCCWGINLSSTDSGGVWLPFCDYEGRKASVRIAVRIQRTTSTTYVPSSLLRKTRLRRWLRLTEFEAN
jgi:hypothetical protein